jgi:sec-independent protein translocase protein TatA
VYPLPGAKSISGKLTKPVISDKLETLNGGEEIMRPPGPLEMGLILLIVLIIFGAGKLPQVFRAAGQGLREFRMAKEGEYDEPKPKRRPVKKTEGKPKRRKKSAKKA